MKPIMLSRVADGMFWLNRYMERTDGMLLTLNTFYILSFDKEMNDSQGYKPLLEYYTDLTRSQIAQTQYDTNFVLKYIICDNINHNSVKNLVIKARENARGSQDKITKELWEHINSLYHYMNSPDLPKKLETSDALNVVNKLNKDLLLYNGIFNFVSIVFKYLDIIYDITSDECIIWVKEFIDYIASHWLATFSQSNCQCRNT